MAFACTGGTSKFVDQNWVKTGERRRLAFYLRSHFSGFALALHR